MNEKDMFKFGSLPNLLEELELMSLVKFSGHYGQVTSEATKKQKKIFEAFGVDWQTYV